MKEEFAKARAEAEALRAECSMLRTRGEAKHRDGLQSHSNEVQGMCAEYHKEQLVTIQGQLNEVRDELNSAIVKLKMQALDHQQEIKCIKWEHELERNRLQWDQDQERDRLAWDHKQELMRLMPTAQKLQKELEQVTARLLDSQEDKRAIEAKLEATDRNLRMEKARLHVELMELNKTYQSEKEEWEASLESQEAAPCSPMKSTTCNICMDKSVNMVFPCGHAKCSECA